MVQLLLAFKRAILPKREAIYTSVGLHIMLQAYTSVQADYTNGNILCVLTWRQAGWKSFVIQLFAVKVEDTGLQCWHSSSLETKLIINIIIISIKSPIFYSKE